MRRILATLAVVVALLFSAGAAWADFDDGLAAFERGDYATALREWLPLAEQGDVSAQYFLGVMYSYGRGVPQNDAEAVKWYRKAAEQGFAQAQYNLGVMYYFGEGVSVNSIKAYMWWSLAMEQGNELATENLNIIKEKMSSAEISIAQELATDMWEKINN